jgi:flagellin
VRARSREAAIRNTEDGLMMANQADKGLSSASRLLSRMRTLAVQSASETLGDTERQFIEEEFTALLDQVDQNAKSNLHNGKTIISPPGVDVGLLIDASGSMGGEKNQVVNSVQNFIDAFTTARYNIRVGVAAYAITKDSIDNVALQAQLGSSNTRDALSGLVLDLGPVDPYAAMTETVGITSIVGDVENDRFSFRPSAVRMLIMVTDAPRSANRNGMVESEVAAALADEEVQLHAISPTSAFGDYDDIVTETGGSIYDIGDSSGSNISTALDSIAIDAIDALNNRAPITIHTGPDASDRIETPFPLDASVLGLELGAVSVGTVAAAQDALDILDTAIGEVAGMRGQVGAIQRRLGHALERNSVALEAETAAESRISDQDIAIASTELTAAQIRQQALFAATAAARQIDRDTAERLLR